MKKIAIVTINGYFNYGNRLQNYALETIIKNLGANVETLFIDQERMFKTGNKQIHYIIAILKSFKRDLKKGRVIFKDKYRRSMLKKFSYDFLNESDRTFRSRKSLEEYCEKFDFVIAGSDQVWNPYYFNYYDIMYLNFVPKNKRMSYAASFGINSIPNEFKNQAVDGLYGMEQISVREVQAQKIVKELTNRDSKVHLDPTFLLSKDERTNIEKKPVNFNVDKYIFCYMLGDYPEYNDYIKKIAATRDLKIINFSDKTNMQNYNIGPQEFIYLVNNAKYVFTDSFHGTVFSIIFEKPFLVFKRVGHYEIFSRLDTILKKFKLEDRIYGSSNNQLDKIDFTFSQTIINEEKTRSITYLRSILEL